MPTPVRASVSAGVRVLDAPPDLEEELRRWVEEELYAEARAGRLRNLGLRPMRYAHVGGHLGVAVDATFEAGGARTFLTAHFFSRGTLLYSLVFARPEALEGYGRVFDRILAGVRTVEPDLLRWARGRALLAPDDPGALRGLGLAAMRVGELREARRALERAMALAPDDPVAVAELARLALREGLVGETCRLAAQARLLDPAHPRTLAALADCALAQGDRTAALARLREAAAASPDDSVLQRRLERIGGSSPVLE